jgi:hypothetical protein
VDFLHNQKQKKFDSGEEKEAAIYPIPKHIEEKIS